MNTFTHKRKNTLKGLERKTDLAFVFNESKSSVARFVVTVHRVLGNSEWNVVKQQQQMCCKFEVLQTGRFLFLFKNPKRINK